jgi:hypothetical protein
MKKILCILSILFLTVKVNAAVSISNTNSVVVGNTVTFRVTVSSQTPLGSGKYNVTYNDKLLKYTGGSKLVDTFVAQNENTKSLTYTFSFVTRDIGNANFKFNLNELYYLSEAPGPVESKTASVNILKPKYYSSNNYLKNLSVEGYDIGFNKDKMSYDVTLKETKTSIVINAEKQEATQTISGIGEVSLEEGMNKKEIEVKAENQSVRIYTLNIFVPEKAPLKIKVNDKEYSVIRKKIEDISGFTKDKIKLKDEEIEVLKNNKYTILYVKDEKGNIFKVLKDKENYKMILDFNNTLYAIEGKKEIKNNYEYFKAVNLTTSKENNYRFELTEKTLQIEENKKEIKKINIDKVVIIVLSSILIITYLIFIVAYLKRRKS